MSDIVLDLQKLTRRFASLRRSTLSPFRSTPASLRVARLQRGWQDHHHQDAHHAIAALLGRAPRGGFSITDQAVDVRRSIGYVPQASPWMVRSRLRTCSSSPSSTTCRVRAAGAHRRGVGVHGSDRRGRRLVSQYSGGMVRAWKSPSQRCIGRACYSSMNRPSVGTRLRATPVWKHLVDLRPNYGTTFVLHYPLPEEAESHCDRIAIMHWAS